MINNLEKHFFINQIIYLESEYPNDLLCPRGAFKVVNILEVNEKLFLEVKNKQSIQYLKIQKNNSAYVYKSFRFIDNKELNPDRTCKIFFNRKDFSSFVLKKELKYVDYSIGYLNDQKKQIEKNIRELTQEKNKILKKLT
jgi:hypothetical protein